MGYHITLVRSPVGPIPWEELAAAARRLGWNADDRAREVRLETDGRLVARVIHDEEDGPWTKSSDDAALAAMIALGAAVGARARGDEFESYRSVDDWYVHPDDRPVLKAIETASGAARDRRAQRGRLWDGFRIVVLLGCVVIFGLRIWTDMQ